MDKRNFNFNLILIILLLCLMKVVISGRKPPPPTATSSYSPGGQYIMLTFSNGPHYFLTSKILDLLRLKKVKATFFVYGSKAMHHVDLIRKIVQDGHELAHQGFLPVNYLKTTKEQIEYNIESSKNLLFNQTKYDVKYFRPPNCFTNDDINIFIKKKFNQKVILYNLDARDKHEKSVQTVVDNISTKAKPGDIILMHDTVNKTFNSLPAIIDNLYEQGYEFLTMSAVDSFPDDSPH